MMFIVRGARAPATPGVAVKLSRPTPEIARLGAGATDFFCLAEAPAIAELRAAGDNVVELRDGYYEDGKGGGVAIWGQGRYWEIRADPFTVVEAVGAASAGEGAAGEGEHVEVRRAIFGG